MASFDKVFVLVPHEKQGRHEQWYYEHPLPLFTLFTLFTLPLKVVYIIYSPHEMLLYNQPTFSPHFTVHLFP